MNQLDSLERIADALESIADSLAVLVDGQDVEQEIEQPVDSHDMGLG